MTLGLKRPRWLTKANLPPLGLIAIALIAALLSAIGILPNVGALALVLAIFSALLFNDVLLTDKVQELDNSFRGQKARLANLSSSVDFMGALLQKTSEKTYGLLDPSDMEDYVRAWSGFEGRYMAFNPSYKAETLLRADEIVERVYEPRFSDPKFGPALYLFFVNSEKDAENLENFRSLLTQTATRCGTQIVTDKLKLRVLEEKHPGYEFYIGSKGGVNTAVVDFALPPTMAVHGVPSYVFILQNTTILVELGGSFISYWDRAETNEVPVGEFLKSGWSSKKPDTTGLAQGVDKTI